MVHIHPGMPQPTRFIDPAALTKISSLELIARTVVEGFIAGLHRSPHLGFSVNFAEYRPYRPGDDIRKIDWKVYGRLDRYSDERSELLARHETRQKIEMSYIGG